MKIDKKLGILLAVFVFLLFGFVGYLKKKTDLKAEMIKSGERFEIPKEFYTSESDYDSFLKSKLLNRSTSGNSILINPKELGIASIGGRVRASLDDKINGIYLVAPSGGGLWKFNAETQTMNLNLLTILEHLCRLRI